MVGVVQVMERTDPLAKRLPELFLGLFDRLSWRILGERGQSGGVIWCQSEIKFGDLSFVLLVQKRNRGPQ